MRFHSAILSLACLTLASNSAHGFATPSVTSSRIASAFHTPSTAAAASQKSKTLLYVSQVDTPTERTALYADTTTTADDVDSSVAEFNTVLVVEGEDEEKESDEFKKGFAIIALITLFNASLSPVWHAVYEGNGPPPLFLNAVVSITAFLGLVVGAPLLDGSVESTSALKDTSEEEKWSAKSFRGGMELGLWKGLGTTCHIYGMALTTANHGAFLLQLTTLIVPVMQGLRGAEKIPRQIQYAVGFALMGIVLFTQDPTKASEIIGDPSLMRTGDILVLAAAFFYSLYDIQTFYWGREVPRTELVTIKVGFQCLLSITLCAVAARTEVMEYLNAGPNWEVLVPTVLWSGLIVNALATFLQVGGMQSVGPTRAQTIFASQPLWASIMNYFVLGSVMGTQGFVGGGAFLGALVLAATAEAPLPALEGAEEES